MLAEHIWSRTNKKYEKSTKSHKQFYRCNLVRSRCKIQCSSACVIIKPPNTTKVEVWRTICPHDHKEKPLSVTIAARIAIDKMFQVLKSIKPKIILANLEKMNTLIVEENVKKHQDLARKD